MPTAMRPTSASSTRPSKIISPMSATVAMVVPSLNMLDSMMNVPFLTGMSRTIPSTVDSTRFETLPDRLAEPSRISSTLFSAWA